MDNQKKRLTVVVIPTGCRSGELGHVVQRGDVTLERSYLFELRYLDDRGFILHDLYLPDTALATSAPMAIVVVAEMADRLKCGYEIAGAKFIPMAVSSETISDQQIKEVSAWACMNEDFSPRRAKSLIHAANLTVGPPNNLRSGAKIVLAAAYNCRAAGEVY